MNQQEQNHRHRMDSGLSHWGLKCILLVPNIHPRFSVLNVRQSINCLDQGVLKVLT